MFVEEGKFDFSVEILRRDKQVLSQWFPLGSSHWSLRIVYSSRMNNIGVGIIGTAEIHVEGELTIQNQTMSVSIIHDDTNQTLAYGVCNLLSMDKINPGIETLYYNLKISFGQFSPPIAQILNPIAIPPPTVLPPEGNSNVEVEQYITIKALWSVKTKQLKEQQPLVSKRYPLISNRGIFWWITMTPCGLVLRAGGERKWSITFNINHPNMEMGGYFYYNNNSKEYNFKHIIHEAVSLSSMTCPDFRVTRSMINSYGSARFKNEEIAFSFRLKIKPSIEQFNPSAVDMKPEFVNPIVNIQEQLSSYDKTNNMSQTCCDKTNNMDQTFCESSSYQFGRLLQTEEGYRIADAVIYARSKKVMPIHSFLIKFHSNVLYELYKTESEKEVQQLEGELVILNLDYSIGTLKKAIEFFYFGKFESRPSIDELVELIHFLSYYKAKYLEDYLLQYVENIIDRDNTCPILKIADEVDNQTLMDICLEFLAKHHTELATLNKSEDIPSHLINCIFKKVKNINNSSQADARSENQITPTSDLPIDVVVKAEPMDLLDDIEEGELKSNPELGHIYKNVDGENNNISSDEMLLESDCD